MWEQWVKKEVDAEEHGILSERWTLAVQQALTGEEGDALQKTMDVLVPSEMPSETFWTRYFFRVHQVEAEEERRKALIEGTTENEEDINWESDDDETADSTIGAVPSAMDKLAASQSTARMPKSEASRETVMPTIPTMTSVASTPATNSPRLSSEDSYDVVSSQVSNAGDAKPAEGEKKEHDEDEDDSDWE
ncbi:hypothetical protein NM688_g2834 [Phlebia brevispora]|uniref:Uncharacterized protein n=1 Tax=Phlebia brevispora TaxID=194682 RepID=A0ACC1T7W5_9APHY|nr:hypothetical protein NM688_g2834 [Phlebia brevispora]